MPHRAYNLATIYQSMGTQKSTSEAEGSRDLFVLGSLRNIITFKYNPAGDPRYGPE
jgi:hypothetical protein